MNPTLNTLAEQLRQLDALRACGALDEGAHAQSRTALERRIVEAVLAAPKGVAQAKAGGGRQALVLAALAALVVLVVGGAYAWLGAPSVTPASMGASTPATPEAPHALGKDQMTGMVQALATRLEADPADAEGWAMLARSYAVLGNHAEAVSAFERAQALKKDDPVLLADHADALAMRNGRRLEGGPATLVERALELDPANLKALSLAGTAAFDRKDYAGAVTHWEKLQRLAPADDPLLRQVQGGIAEARRLAGPAPVPAAGAAAVGSAKVGGTVTLAAALVAQASPDDTLFVFARAAQGSRMPLAMLRKQVKDLPLAFTLDDSLAMSPDDKLSAHPQVIVSARISKSGQATPQAGDLQGHSAAVSLGRTDLRVEIAQRLRP